MEDRALMNNGKSSYIKATLPSTYADFITAMAAGTQLCDVTPRDELTTDPGITAVGTALNTANILSNSTATALGLTSSATPNDAFANISNKLDVVNTVTFATGDWAADTTEGGYKAVKTVSGITANSMPIPSLHYSTMTESTCKLESKAYGNVRKFVTGAGTITAHATAIPATAFSVDFRGI